ncbi:MAG: hypothetical protein QOD30_1249, partial [Actinomycetota bacterium]|nr:hypothetical protein [Actinomycetota bacterium]
LTGEDWAAAWELHHSPSARVSQRVLRALPSSPRCGMCGAPFAGLGRAIVGPLGYRPSRKNPTICSTCVEASPPGGITAQTGILFADLRGFTTRFEGASPLEASAVLNRFYACAEDVLFPEAIIDKLIGDEVMALFIPGLAGTDYRRKAALAAIELAATVEDVPIGIAASAGIAFVGNVGSGTVLDFTALGDAVNTAARLQSEAAPGEVVLLAEVYDLVAAEHPGASRKRVEVRGRDAPVDIAVLACGRFAS